ncbi:MAG: hypothetical protein VX663_02360 [Pseudomonadota bacterium]|nr:hypothetical protein [Pseudomonadota bacterium]
MSALAAGAPAGYVGVRVVAWTWITTGSLLMGLAFVGTAPGALLNRLDLTDLPAELVPLRGLLGVLADWWVVLLVAQFLVGFAVTFAAARLLTGYAWARRAIEWCSWLGVAQSVLFGVVLATLWNDLVVSLEGIPGDQRDLAQAAGLVVTGAVTALFVTPMAWMACYLRLTRVRNSFR